MICVRHRSNVAVLEAFDFEHVLFRINNLQTQKSARYAHIHVALHSVFGVGA